MASSAFPTINDGIGVRIVAAIGRRRELGFENRLLFRLKDDMVNFRTVTKAKPLIMGRKTWDSFPKKPLPGRPNIVATRNLSFEAAGAFVYSSLPPALAAGRAMAALAGVDEVCVIGGAEIYAAGLEVATSMTLTEVDAEREADVFFPAFDPKQWQETAARRIEVGPDNEASFVIRELRRISTA